MKIVIITGSPRRKGNSNFLAEQFAKGAMEAGHEVFTFDSAKHKIYPCIASNRCGMDGECSQKDDFSALLRPRIEDADMIVLASPVYYFGLSAQLKTVIDRFYALNSRMRNKKSALLLAMADMDDATARFATEHYRGLAQYLGWINTGEVTAKGVWMAGDVKDSTYAAEAYSLGRNLK